MKVRLTPRAKPKATPKRVARTVASTALFIRAAGAAAASASQRAQARAPPPLPANSLAVRPYDFGRLTMPTFMLIRTCPPMPLRYKLERIDPIAEDTERLSIFRHWSEEVYEHDWSISTVRRMLDFLDALFLEGGDHHTAAAMVTTVRQAFPAVQQEERLYSRLAKALEGWPRVALTTPQLMMPEDVVYAILGEMFSSNKPIMAGSLLVQLKLYLRPGESDRVRPNHIYSPPAGADAELDQYGVMLSHEDFDALMLDGTSVEDLLAGQVLETLKFTYARSMWNHSTIQLDTEFRRSLEKLNVGSYAWCRYSVRFAGATADLQRHYRSTREVQARGRWQSAMSMPALRQIRPEPPALDARLVAYAAMVKQELTRYIVAPKKCPSFKQWCERDNAMP